MKTALFYFSGTGSSYWAAKTTANLLGNCDLHPIGSSDPARITVEYERMGFFFPNYYGHIPRPVKNFLRTVPLNNIRYCFVIAAGGRIIGIGLKELDEALRERGCALNYGGELLFGSNYIVAPYYKATMLEDEKLDRQLKKNEMLIRQMVQDIDRGMSKKIPVQKRGTNLPTLIYRRRLEENRLNLDRDFSVSAHCKGCALCAGILDSEKHRPRWEGNCEDCCACIQACPREAVLLKGKKLNKPRYWHPDSPVKEMILAKN